MLLPASPLPHLSLQWEGLDSTSDPLNLDADWSAKSTNGEPGFHPNVATFASLVTREKSRQNCSKKSECGCVCVLCVFVFSVYVRV